MEENVSNAADQIRSVGRQYLINKRQQLNNPSLIWDELVAQTKKDMKEDLKSKGRSLWGSSWVNYIPGLELIDPKRGRGALNNVPWQLSLSPTVPPVVPQVAAPAPVANSNMDDNNNADQIRSVGKQYLINERQRQSNPRLTWDELVEQLTEEKKKDLKSKGRSLWGSSWVNYIPGLELIDPKRGRGAFTLSSWKLSLSPVLPVAPLLPVPPVAAPEPSGNSNNGSHLSHRQQPLTMRNQELNTGVPRNNNQDQAPHHSSSSTTESKQQKGKSKRDATAEKGSPNSHPRQRGRVESNNKSNGDAGESSQDGVSTGAPKDKSTDKDESESVDQSSLLKNKPVAYNRRVDALEFEKISKSYCIVSPFPEEFTSKLLSQASKRMAIIDLPNLGKWKKVQVLDKLGDGAYGSVWKCDLYPVGTASDPIRCAVKVQIPSKDTSLSSLSFEFTTQLSLDFHADEECPFPRSIALYTYTDEDGTNNGGLLFMTLESGVTVHDIAFKAFPGEAHVPMEIVACVADRLLTRLETLHNLGVLHCDIKTDNCMLTESGALKVIDFGRAQNLPSLTYTFRGSSVGTDRSMMSKNKRQDKSWGVDQDLYGLCVTIFFLIYKDHPTESNTRTDKSGKMSFSPKVAHFSIPRGYQRDMWTKFFDLLLNIDPSEYTKTVRSARALLRSYMEEEENKKKIEEELKNLLSRLSNLH